MQHHTEATVPRESVPPLVAAAVAMLVLSVASSVVAQSSTQRFGGPKRPTPPGTSPAASAGPASPTKPSTPARPPLQSFGAQVEQAERAAPRNLKTFVEFTVLTPVVGGSLDGQRWAKLLSDLGLEATFRGPTGGDELGVEETKRGTLRTVRVVGQLGGDGRLRIADQVYTIDDAKRLKEWLNELQLYGAQGAPGNQPLWGLTEAQFTSVYEALSQPVTTELEGQTLSAALTKLPLPTKHPLGRSANADARFATLPETPIENQTLGLSCGTTLAVILSESGLGFAPVRTPTGQIDLSIVPLGELQVWPLGWELNADVDHGQLVPILHKFSEIGFETSAVQDVLDATAAAIEVPIIVDHHAIRGLGVNLAEKSVSYPPKRTTWALMLNTVIRKVGLIKSVRTDERGQPFVFITPFVPTPVEPDR